MVLDRVADIGRELSLAFEELVRAIPSGAQRPQEVARALALDKSISHRLLTAIRKGDPVATTHIIPSPEALRKIAKAARSSNVPVSIVERADRATLAFEELIRTEAGDRAGLDAIISTSLPSAREKYQSVAKQTIYRGARQLKGLAAEIQLSSHMLHPARTPGKVDHAALFGYLGLGRLLPNAKLKIAMLAGASMPEARAHTFDRRPIEQPDDLMCPRVGQKNDCALTVHHFDETRTHIYELDWQDAVGPNSVRDAVMRQLFTNVFWQRCHADTATVCSSITEVIDVPAKVLLLDFFIHKDIYPDWRPVLQTFQSGAHGLVRAHSHINEFDILPLSEQLVFLGVGVDQCRTEEIPDYIDMLRDGCALLGWNHKEFRGYRARIEYPIFQSQVRCLFDLPPAETN